MDPCKPSVEILTYTDKAPIIIAGTAKLTLSSKPLNNILETMEKSEVSKWLMELIRRGHGSPLEHGVYSFEIICSRVTSHQIVRHRIASYTQLSQRRGDKLLREVVKYASIYLGIEYPGKPIRREEYLYYVDILSELLESNPSWEDLLEITCRGFIVPPKPYRERDRDFLERLIGSLINYYRALAKGYHPEDARYLLPQAVKTRLYITMNARELVENFLPLRMCAHAQWEIRYIAWSLWRQLSRIHPEIFMYTGPRCVLYENRVRNEPCSLEEFIKGERSFTIERCPELVSCENIFKCLRNASADPWGD